MENAYGGGFNVYPTFSGGSYTLTGGSGDSISVYPGNGVDNLAITLNGASLSSFSLAQNTTLRLTGQNTADNISGMRDTANGYSFTIEGPGSLTAENITVNGDIILNSGTVTVTFALRTQASASRKVTIAGGVLNASSSSFSPIICDGGMEVTGGTVKVTAPTGSAGITTNGHSKDIVISGGSVTVSGGSRGLEVQGKVSISGGSVTVSGSQYGISGAAYITGGSVKASGGQPFGSGVYRSGGNGFYVPLFLVTLSGLNAGEEVSSLSAPGGYGFNDAAADASGKLYFYLPEGETEISLTAANAVYTGSINVLNNDNNAVTLTTTDPGPAPTPTPIPVVNPDEKEETKPAPVTTVKDGNATATATVSGNYGSETSNKTIVAKSDINNAISAAVEAAKKNNAAPKVEIKLDTTKKAEQVQASLPVSSLKKTVRDGIKSFALNTGIASIAFDNDALKGLSGQAADSSLRISVAKVNTDTLTDEVKTKIGGAAVYEFTIMDGIKAISNFGGGKATVTIPYTLKAGESADGVVVWYIGSDGTLTKVEGAKYDAAAKTVTFETTHFSAYAVAYDPAAAEPSAESASPAVSGGSSEAIPATGDSFAFGAVLLLVTVSLGAGITLKKAR